MVFNDTTTKNGLIQDCESWLFGSDYGVISSNPTLLDKFTSLLNYGVDRTSVKILENDGKWQYDDNNHTDFPEATTDLSDNNRNYILSKTFMKIEGFECLDKSGNYYPLTKIDKEEIRRMGFSISEFMETAGVPQYYDVDGDTVTLFPAPATGSVTMTDGLKVLYQRPSSYFVSTDTDKEVGVASPFTDMPSLYACQKYAKQNSMRDKARELDAEVLKRENELETLISNRWKDQPTQIITKYRSSR